MGALRTYPYLIESFVLVLIAALGLLLLPRQRMLLVLSGGLCAPNGLLTMIHVPWFWNPRVTIHYLIIPEDLLWLVAAGMVTWFLAAAPFASRTTWNARPREVLIRYGACAALEAAFLALTLLVWPEPEMVMYPTIAAMVLMSATLACYRPAATRFALAGGIGYTVFHTLDVLAFLHFWPETASYWNPAAQLPFAVFGIPTFEIVFAMAFGVLWPLTMAVVCDVRIGERPARGSISTCNYADQWLGPLTRGPDSGAT